MVKEILQFVLESEEASSEEADLKLLSAQPEDKIYSLDDMKAAEPGFFSRESIKWHGTKKIYKYGNFLVLKNVKKVRGNSAFNHNVFHQERYAVYEFSFSEDGKGYMRYRAEGISLDDAKDMIKKKDFRDFRERVSEIVNP